MCGFLAEDKLLLKMRTDRKTESYWTLIDATGKIHPLPRTLRRVLNSEEWTDMSIQPIIDAQNQLLLKSKDSMVAFRFGERGNILNSIKFTADDPEVNLLANTFLGNYEGELY